ncbi:hypothetical protein, partial [Okeania sp. SIO3B5]|uniref:hypothetical protein n=1 Tax=Okeania sp. SIO3B5 TaxID=2607811 RepID=UPI0025E2CEAF
QSLTTPIGAQNRQILVNFSVPLSPLLPFSRSSLIYYTLKQPCLPGGEPGGEVGDLSNAPKTRSPIKARWRDLIILIN